MAVIVMAVTKIQIVFWITKNIEIILFAIKMDALLFEEILANHTHDA